MFQKTILRERCRGEVDYEETRVEVEGFQGRYRLCFEGYFFVLFGKETERSEMCRAIESIIGIVPISREKKNEN